MHNKSLRALAVFAALIGVETPLLAQTGVQGPPGPAQSRPRRKLRKNSAPALSPALNLLPEISNTFEGQFLMRQLPQEQFLKANVQANKNFDRIENQLGQQEQQIQTGLGKTGHTVSYLNYGRYYQSGTGRGTGGRQH